MDRVTILSLMVSIVNLRTEISDVKCGENIPTEATEANSEFDCVTAADDGDGKHGEAEDKYLLVQNTNNKYALVQIDSKNVKAAK